MTASSLRSRAGRNWRARHTRLSLPLLPSGPGGVQAALLADPCADATFLAADPRAVYGRMTQGLGAPAHSVKLQLGAAFPFDPRRRAGRAASGGAGLLRLARRSTPPTWRAVFGDRRRAARADLRAFDVADRAALVSSPVVRGGVAGHRRAARAAARSGR